jgi:membrane protein
MIDQASQPAESIFATLIGIALLLMGATGLFQQLQESLNAIWEVQARPGGIRVVVKDRLLSFIMVLGIGFLLLVLLVVSTLIAALSNYIGTLLPGMDIFWRVVEFLVSFAISTVLFAMIFKVLPEVQNDWQDVWLGAAVTALLFTIGRLAIGLYLGTRAFTDTYGAAASLIIILLWVYYSAQILFFGAEFTQVYANRSGKRIPPEPGARRLTEHERAEQGMPAARVGNLQAPGTAALMRQNHLGQWDSIPHAFRPEPVTPATRKSLLALTGLLTGLAGFIGGVAVARRSRTKRGVDEWRVSE